MLNDECWDELILRQLYSPVIIGYIQFFKKDIIYMVNEMKEAQEKNIKNRNKKAWYKNKFYEYK